MSIQVPLEDLAAEVARRGPGYLLTATPGGRPHVMHVVFDRLDGESGEDAAAGGRFRVGIGRTAAANIAAEEAVSLLWPPIDAGGEHDGYSLIADATAAVEAAADGSFAVLTPVHAILHRPAR